MTKNDLISGVISLLNEATIPEHDKNSYRAIVWFLPEDRLFAMLEKLRQEKRLRESIKAISNDKSRMANVS